MDKNFPLGDVLSIVTGRIVSDRGVKAFYDILNHMTRDDLYSNQLPRVIGECKPWLLRWFPELSIVLAPASQDSLSRWIASAPTCPEEGVKMWLAELRMMQPALLEEYAVPQIPQDDHERKDPYDELVAMRGTDEGIVLVTQVETER